MFCRGTQDIQTKAVTFTVMENSKSLSKPGNMYSETLTF